MKILVIGAGLIGSVVASQLKRNGQDVTVLARGQHADDLRSFGIVTHPLTGEEYFTTHPAVVETLTPQDVYDVILVILRRNHHHDVLPLLAKNQHYKKVVFLGNNLGGGTDLLEYLPSDKIILGFGGTTGEKRGDIIYHYADEQNLKMGKIWLGELSGVPSKTLLELKVIFEDAGFETELNPEMAAWLKTHAALVLPIAFSLYLCDGSNYRLAKTRDAVLLAFRGVKEGIKVLKKLQTPILPAKYQLFSLVPEPIAVRYLQKFFNTEFARIGLAVHANHAKDEMIFLAKEFKALIALSGVATPNLDQLYAIADKEDESQVILPEGSQSKRLDWKPIWIGAGILTGILGALGYLLTQRKRKQ